MTYKTNPMLWYASKTALNQSGFRWRQSARTWNGVRVILFLWKRPPCGGRRHATLNPSRDGRQRLTYCRKSLRTASCCVLWSHTSHREQDKERQSPKHQASTDGFNEWREKLHRWSSEERLTCRELCKAATGESLGQGWSKHFCHRGGPALKIQLFKH